MPESSIARIKVYIFEQGLTWEEIASNFGVDENLLIAAVESYFLKNNNMPIYFNLIASETLNRQSIR